MESFRVEETFLFALTRPLLLCIYRVRLGRHVRHGLLAKSAAHRNRRSQKGPHGQRKRGFPIATMRDQNFTEVEAQKRGEFEEIVTSKAQKANDMKGSIYLVFEYMDHDLAGLNRRDEFSEEQIKCYMKQLFQGLHYCHTNNICIGI